FLLAGLGELLELEAVGDQHAHGGELQRMDGVRHSFDVAGNRLAVPVRKEGRNPSLVHPGHGVDMQTGLPLPRRRILVTPWPKGEAAGVMSGSEHQNVAL